MREILDFFPEGFTPSPEQRALLLEYERLPDYVQLVCIVMPVAAGKSLMLDTIGAYEAAKRGGATLVAPTNHLVGQLFDEGLGKRGWKIAPYKAQHGDWDGAKGSWEKEPLKLANTYSYLAHRAYSPCVLFDEAHTLTRTLQEMEAIKVWEHIQPWPKDIRTMEQFLMWLHNLVPETKADEKLKKFLKKDVSEFIMERSVEEYRWEQRECLKIMPLTPRNNKPVFWPPSRVKRLVLTSATLSQEDLYDLGLDRKKAAWLLSESRIPKERRPLVYMPFANPTFGREGEYRKLAEGILTLSNFHAGERGLIHVSYSLSDKLKPYLKHDRRFIFHSQLTKKNAFDMWQKSTDGVLLGAGMHEGINLKYDRCRWQGIAKIMWPSQEDYAVLVKSRERPDWYVWEAVKILLQSYGRVCRMPDDEGITYILTEEFERLLKMGRSFFTKWALEALE